MKAVFIILLFCIFSVNSKTDNQPVVIYSDYMGTHTVKGRKISNEQIAFNQDYEQQIHIATAEWSPYIGLATCQNGWVLQSVVAILSSLKIGSTITFYPWARAVQVAEAGQVDLLLPVYHIDNVAKSIAFPDKKRSDTLFTSKPIGWGPIAFIKRKDYNTQHFVNHESLKSERVGVVRGYQNSPDIDRLIESGHFEVTYAVNDINNLNLLLNKRVNLIVADPNVISSAIEMAELNWGDKQKLRRELELIEPIIKMHALFFAFPTINKKSKQLADIINTRIDEFTDRGVLSEIKYQNKRRSKTNPLSL